MSVNRQSSVNSAAGLAGAIQHNTSQNPEEVDLFSRKVPTVQLPYNDKTLRACKNCHRVLTEIQFFKDGCTGCYPKGNGALPRNKLNEYTTQQFHGYVGVIDPSLSWVARVIGLGKKAPIGVYAAQVESDDEDYEADSAMGDDIDDFYRSARGDYAGEDGGDDFEEVLERFAGDGGDSALVRQTGGDGEVVEDSEGGARSAKKSRVETNYGDLLEGLVE